MSQVDQYLNNLMCAERRDLFDLRFRVAVTQLDEQYRRARGLEVRASTTAALSTALASVTAILLSGFSDSTSVAPLSFLLTVIIALAFVTALLYSLKALEAAHSVGSGSVSGPFY